MSVMDGGDGPALEQIMRRLHYLEMQQARINFQEDLWRKRETTARERGIQLGKLYGIKAALQFFGPSLTASFKRGFKAGWLIRGKHYLRLTPERNYRMSGYQIVDFILGGIDGPQGDPWPSTPNDPTKPGSGGSTPATVSGSDADTTTTVDKQSASRLARETFSKPKKD